MPGNLLTSSTRKLGRKMGTQAQRRDCLKNKLPILAMVDFTNFAVWTLISIFLEGIFVSLFNGQYQALVELQCRMRSV